MIRILGSLAAAAAFSTIATAQTVSAPEGDWVWNTEMSLNGLKVNNSGGSCVTPEETQIDLAALVQGIDETCSISDWNEEDGLVHFSVSCFGEHAANMSGEISLGESDASLTLAGAVRFGDSGPIATIVNGKAARTGVCGAPDAPDTEAEPVEVVLVEEVAAEPVEVDLIEEDAAEREDGRETPKAAPTVKVEVGVLEDIVAQAPEAPSSENTVD